MTTWWLSFVGGVSEGACIVDAPSFFAAVRKTHALGINPGGEVKGVEYPEPLNTVALEEIALWGKDRLISRADLIASGRCLSESELRKLWKGGAN